MLESHPAIAGAAVVAARDNLRNVVPKAIVVLKPGVKLREADIRRYCEERLMRCKVPRLVEFVSELPQSPAGKISYRQLAAGKTSALVQKLEAGDYSRETLTQALACRGPVQRQLFALARQRREAYFPNRGVQVRSVIEISNICRQRCNYCNIGGTDQSRYIIAQDEFLALANFVYNKGRRVLLVQSGENRSQTFVRHVCRCLKVLTQRYRDLKIVLCLGNLEEAQYRQLRAAGAEWYILKFETSNPKLYRKIKPHDTLRRRLECLASLLRVGFKVGSGNMVGLPGQTIAALVDDLYLLGQYKLVTQSCSVFIPGEKSKYAAEPMGDLNLTLNMLALMRIMYPDRLIPTTSSLERARPGGQYLGLMAGANTVTIHDGTPSHLKRLFPIYSTKRFTPQDDHLRQIVRKAGLVERSPEGPAQFN